MIESLHKKHDGEECAILLNGPTLSDYDLKRIDCVTIGVNRSWMLHDADYHVAVDDSHWKQFSRLRGDVTKLAPLIAGPDGPPHAMRVNDLTEKLPEVGPVRPGWRAPFGWSWDLEEGAYLCASISLWVLQVAVYMGFHKIYLIGFDLADRATCRLDVGPCEHEPPHARISKFKTHPEAHRIYRAERWEPRQRELMAKVAKTLKINEVSTFPIWNLSPITKCVELPRKTFEEVFIERKGREARAGNRNPELQQAAARKAAGDRASVRRGNGKKKSQGKSQSRRRGKARR